MSSKSNTTINNILAAVKMEVGITDVTNYDAWLKLCINEYIREFDCFETYLKLEKEVRIEGNGTICLPDNFYSLGVLRTTCCNFNNYENCPADNNTNPSFTKQHQHNTTSEWYYLDTNCLGNWGVNCRVPNNCNVGSYQINGDRLVLHGNFKNITHAVLCYEGYQTDEYGNFINMPKEFENAVMFRIAHRFMINPRNRKNFVNDTIDWYDRKAVAMFNKVRGKSALRQFRNRMPEISDWSNALLCDMNIINR